MGTPFRPPRSGAAAAEPARRLPPTAAERSLDERIARVRDADPPAGPKAVPAERATGRSEEIRPAPPPKEREPARARSARERDDPDARFPARHEDKFRARPAPAEPALRERRVTDPVKRADRPQPASRPRSEIAGRTRPERDVESFERLRDRQREAKAAAAAPRRPDASPVEVGRRLREIGPARETVRPVGGVPGRRPSGRRPRAAAATRFGPGSSAATARVSGPARARRSRRPAPARRAQARQAGRIGRPAISLRDKGLDPRLQKQKEKETEKDRETRAKGEERERPPKPKGPAERLEDLDKRREQALERLKARRQGERRDERRRALSLDRLASMTNRFGGREG